jgi:putative membrane protein
MSNEAAERERDRQSRTGMAGDRTMLAGERTLSAWWRTAIASLAAAVGLFKILNGSEPAWIPRAAATLPVLLSILILVFAARRYVRTARRVEAECVERVPQNELWIGSGLLAILSVAVGAVIWFM